MKIRKKLENKKDFVRKEWNIFNRIDENRMVFAVFGNRRGGKRLLKKRQKNLPPAHPVHRVVI